MNVMNANVHRADPSVRAYKLYQHIPILTDCFTGSSTGVIFWHLRHVFFRAREPNFAGQASEDGGIRGTGRQDWGTDRRGSGIVQANEARGQMNEVRVQAIEIQVRAGKVQKWADKVQECADGVQNQADKVQAQQQDQA